MDASGSESLQSFRWKRIIRWNDYNPLEWDYSTRRWSLMLNLILQPQPFPSAWIKHMEFFLVSFREIKGNPELNKKMQELCVVIASGYCARFENEAFLIPSGIKELVGRLYLFTEPSTYRIPYDYEEDKMRLKWKINQDEICLDDSEYLCKYRAPVSHDAELDDSHDSDLDDLPDLEYIGEIVD